MKKFIFVLALLFLLPSSSSFAEFKVTTDNTTPPTVTASSIFYSYTESGPSKSYSIVDLTLHKKTFIEGNNSSFSLSFEFSYQAPSASWIIENNVDYEIIGTNEAGSFEWTDGHFYDRHSWGFNDFRNYAQIDFTDLPPWAKAVQEGKAVKFTFHFRNGAIKTITLSEELVKEWQQVINSDPNSLN